MMLSEAEKQAIREQNAALNRWAFGPRRRTRRLSWAEAWREAERCRRRMRLFGHY